MLLVLFFRQDAAAFREFLLVKLINGEKATFQTPTFSRKRERTLEMLIKDLYEEYAHDTKMVSSSSILLLLWCMDDGVVCIKFYKHSFPFRFHDGRVSI